MTFIKKPTILLQISFAIAIFVFLKNAWVSEDAYILFRSIEQLFAGNGPVWNPHERVQVYTSPLWYFLLAVVRIFSSDPYLNVIIISLILWLLTNLILKRIFNNNMMLLCSILLFSCSNAFFDYTSSGLENILSYLVIATYVLNYIELFEYYNINNLKRIYIEKRVKIILFLFGLIVCVRHDLALILLPSTIYYILNNTKIFSIWQWIFLSIISLSPFILFSFFSLIYYGFPFPNTAYAKLNTGIDKIEILKQGARYFYASFKYDAITLLVIAGTLIFSFFRPSKNFLKYFSYGILLNLFYVFYIGGDFMQGRFFSHAYIISVILLLKFAKLHSIKLEILSLITIFLYLLLYPHTPFNSSLIYTTNYKIEMGIADERGFYFNGLSLYRYINYILMPDKENKIFPYYSIAYDGYKFGKSPEIITTQTNIGMFGYWSGTEKIIIDSLAVSDPLLARIPVTGWWRVGHFLREIPEGYIQSIINKNEAIVDPQINQFYKN